MRFDTTRWSLIQAAADSADPSYQDALSELCQTYWPAAYAFLRSRGHDVEEARDLTQGFFARVLDKRSLRAATPDRGRFRSFLLASVKNFASHERQKARQAKRGGDTVTISLDFDHAEALLGDNWADRLTPEDIFDKRWALALLRRTMERLEQEMIQAGKATLFRHLKPALAGEATTLPYKELAKQLGMGESNLKVTVHRQRKRFGALLRQEVAETLSDPELLDDEMQHLLGVLAR